MSVPKLVIAGCAAVVTVEAVEAVEAVDALPVSAPTKVVAVTVLSLSNTESIVTPEAAVVSLIVLVVNTCPLSIIRLLVPDVLPTTRTSAKES